METTAQALQRLASKAERKRQWKLAKGMVMGQPSSWQAHLAGSCTKPCRYCAEGLLQRTAKQPMPPPPPSSLVNEPNPLEGWV